MTDWPLLIIVALGFAIVGWLLARILNMLKMLLLAIHGVQTRVFDSHLDMKGGLFRVGNLLEDLKAARDHRRS